jgi:hypothetical protein
LCYKMSWHFIVTQDIINLNCFKKRKSKNDDHRLFYFLEMTNN